MRHLKHTQGFTLIEILVSLTLFLVVMTISMGSVLSVFDANRKSESLKVVMDNLNFTLESMSREIRFGKNYHCGGGSLTLPLNCPNGGGSQISFLASDGVTQVVYRLIGNRIEKSIDGGTSYVAVTAPEIVVQNLTFYVVGADRVPINYLQPKVLIEIKGKAGAKTNTQTTFNLQTLVSQRVLDN